MAAKGYYKRELADRFQRVAAEVGISHLMGLWNEVVFEPVAVVVAWPEYRGRHTDETEYDLLLITKLDESATSLDNAPWALGFTESNLLLAEAAVHALGRFNTVIGMHGDAKVKNFAQRPDGQTSMIDFETSTGMDWSNPLSIAITAHEDLAKLLSSLADGGFYSREPEHARAVLEQLGQIYLDYWADFSPVIQETAAQAVLDVVERQAIALKQNS